MARSFKTNNRLEREDRLALAAYRRNRMEMAPEAMRHPGYPLDDLEDDIFGDLSGDDSPAYEVRP